MPEQRNISGRVKRILGRTRKILVLNQVTVALLVILALSAVVAVVYFSQKMAEQLAVPELNKSTTSKEQKEQFEVAKLAAEIRQIRSDTSGSLFWLKLIALFVTVGGAIGGYLLGQSQTTRKRIEFENRKNVDSAYQSIVQELSDSSTTLLRAAAAVKLGAILKSFPSEWTVSEDRKEQLIELTKQVLAASLAIEDDPKVLKTLTIAIVLHKPWKGDLANSHREGYSDGSNLDLSGAKAKDAYWKKVDFTYSDFYKADLTQASFRQAILDGAQFREAILKDAVLIKAHCLGANFKLADLRNADLSGAKLINVNFDGAKVNGCILTGAELECDLNVQVNYAVEADKTEMISVREWLAKYPPNSVPIMTNQSQSS